MNINQIQAAVRGAGSHWFDPDTMRTYSTAIESPVFMGPGGIFFVSGEDNFNHTQRVYTVRMFDPTNADIKTVGEFGMYGTQKGAKKQARSNAQGRGKLSDVSQHKERLKLISNLEQLMLDLETHGCTPSKLACQELIAKARLHHTYAEFACGIGAVNQESQALLAERKTPVVRQAIEKLTDQMGCEPIFSGDPRGCTVKLKLPDEFTNDFAKEGYCVPREVA